MIVIPTHNFSNLIQWSDDEEGVYYNLYKSTSPNSHFEPVIVNSLAGSFLDEDVNLMEIGKYYYYKVDVLDKDKKKINTLGPVKAEYQKMNGIARAIMAEYEIVLRVMANPTYKLLLKRRSGINCVHCYNETTKRVSFQGCKVCNGTGVIEGYFDPIEIRLSKDISQETEYNSMLDSERVKHTNVNAWALAYPRLSPGDVIVDRLNQRYRITQVSPRTHSHVLLRQILQLVPLEKGSPAYDVEVDFHEQN